MTWFLKSTVFCATLLLLGFTLEVLGYTMFMCKRDCKDEPDDPLCCRWNYTTEDQSRTKVSRYEWLRNECERKCLDYGVYERAESLELCYQYGKNRTTYICSTGHRHPKKHEQCMTNATWREEITKKQ